MADQADRLLELAAPGAAEYDQECDSYSDCDIYMDGGDGIDAYCGVERCGNCQQKRLSAMFPNTALQRGIQDIYYSDWVPAMTESRNSGTCPTSWPRPWTTPTNTPERPARPLPAPELPRFRPHA